MKFPIGFNPKKSLGQSFLVSDKIADKLVSGLQITKDDEVLEIGAGFGNLTTRLCAQAKKVYAVEIDTRLIPVLKENTQRFHNIEIINQDIRQLDWQKFSAEKIIGNIPYNISTEMLSLLLTNINRWHLSVIVTQREFTKKLLAKPGQSGYSAYTVLYDFYTEHKKLLSIPPTAFKPSPKMISTAIVIKKRSSPLFTDIDFNMFRRIVHAAFKQPRKTLSNNLSMVLGVAKKDLSPISAVDLNKRAQDFSLNEFVALTKSLISIIK